MQVCKQTDERSYTKHQPSHVNVQHVIARFQPSDAARSDPSTAHALPSGCTDANAPIGGSTEHTVHNLPSVQSFLLEGHSLGVERDLPHFTLEDFVQSSSSLQGTGRLDYDRQMCVLLLQILMGSQHLYSVGASAAKLRPREIFLVWPCGGEEEGRDMLEYNASGKKTSRLKEEGGWEKTENHGGKVQMLWRAHGTPRVVLIPSQPAPQDSHPAIYIKSQIGALIQYCLQSQESMTSENSGPTLPQSSYRRGLLYLASVLQGDGSGPQIEDMVTMLQVLLWGPRVSVLNRKYHVTTSVHNWLTIKRTLFVMKLAERGLIQDQSTLDWEDSLCLKYLSFTDSEAIASMCGQLWFSLKAI